MHDTRKGMARPRKPSITLPAHVHRVVSRGREYFTYQYARGTKQAGPRIKLPHPTDEGFLAAVRKAAGPSAAPAAGTFEALIEGYRAEPRMVRAVRRLPPRLRPLPRRDQEHVGRPARRRA